MFFAMTTILAIAFLPACKWQKSANQLTKEDSAVMAKINEFAVVKLTTDYEKLTENEKKMIPILIRSFRDPG